jgi:hypothetical protein
VLIIRPFQRGFKSPRLNGPEKTEEREAPPGGGLFYGSWLSYKAFVQIRQNLRALLFTLQAYSLIECSGVPFSRKSDESVQHGSGN